MQTRVLRVRGNYIPQYRVWFYPVWRYFTSDHSVYCFSSLAEAIQFLDNQKVVTEVVYED